MRALIVMFLVGGMAGLAAVLHEIMRITPEGEMAKMFDHLGKKEGALELMDKAIKASSIMNKVTVKHRLTNMDALAMVLELRLSKLQYERLGCYCGRDFFPPWDEAFTQLTANILDVER